jgi:hypothetical protein
MSLLDLPIEILAIITTADLDTFLAALKVPGIGPRLCCEYVQNYAKSVFIKIVKDEWCTKYYLGGKLHRVGGPAVIRKEYWYQNCHKYNSPDEYTTDKPTYITKNMLGYGHKKLLFNMNGVEAYYIHGKLHNSMKPAVLFTDGAQEFWNNGNFMYGVDASGKKYA